MTINYSKTRAEYYHRLTQIHRNEAAKSAIKAGEHLYFIRENLPAGTAWTKWLAENIPQISQRSAYNYIDCYVMHVADPIATASCSSIRELLGTSMAGKPRRILDHTKLQRALLMVARSIYSSKNPKMEAQALVHAVMGTEPASSALHELVADWIDKLQLTPAIK